ncbi:MAG: cytochrome c maturation protein CcmE [Candidatus Binatus sp.]|uniref:cytochrome c maturation protein CcmE n=1 Tax=Candidatus Binatus sp. TaxID=2811406 RepID=UPI002716D9B9|nr:cytochrome c maturation protein CcmE [Candidatus Binatus sp.]MDO8432058.1 cytochrome c maturation protein CcmE [Candidatus Binatus sp.]
MRVRARFFVGAAIIVVAIGYLIVSAIRTTSEYYLTVNEAIARKAELGDQRVRIAGRVKAGTISWEPATLTLKFEMAQIPDAPAGAITPVAASPASELRVIAAGEPKPDMLAAGRDVIVEGTLGAGGNVIATQVLTSCPSKYKPKQAE